MPRVTIGVPVYNGQSSIGLALRYLAEQSERDIEIVVSDNASTDATPDICANFARSDRRVRYVRQDRNIGAARNFLFLLGQSRSEHFMWAAADDRCSADFVAANLSFLGRAPGFGGAISPTSFARGDFLEPANGDFSVDQESPLARIEHFCRTWHDNSMFYGLFRTAAITPSASVNPDRMAWDWSVISRVLRRWKLARSMEGRLVRSRGGESSSMSAFEPMWRSPSALVAPFLPLARSIASDFGDIPGSRPALARIHARLLARGAVAWASAARRRLRQL